MMSAFIELASRVASLERRLAGSVRHGTVAEVDPAAGTVRLDLGPGDDGPLLSAAVPYAQMAGALKVHAPPSVGQTMTLVSPSGDFAQAVAMPLTWSTANPSPGAGADLALTFGDVRIDVTGGSITLTIGGCVLAIDAAGATLTGNLRVIGDLAAEGGAFTHEGVNVGSSHVHTEVTPGDALTGPPP